MTKHAEDRGLGLGMCAGELGTRGFYRRLCGGEQKRGWTIGERYWDEASRAGDQVTVDMMWSDPKVFSPEVQMTLWSVSA